MTTSAPGDPISLYLELEKAGVLACPDCEVDVQTVHPFPKGDWVAGRVSPLPPDSEGVRIVTRVRLCEFHQGAPYSLVIT